LTSSNGDGSSEVCSSDLADCTEARLDSVRDVKSASILSVNADLAGRTLWSEGPVVSPVAPPRWYFFSLLLDNRPPVRRYSYAQQIGSASWRASGALTRDI